MSNGSDIAAEVLAGLQEAGAATGNGPLVCTIRRTTGGAETPWDAGSPVTTYHEVTAIDREARMRDVAGTLILQTVRTLMVDATGVEPLKSDQIAVGVARGEVGPDTEWMQINDVAHVAPGGVPLMYKLEIAR